MSASLKKKKRKKKRSRNSSEADERSRNSSEADGISSNVHTRQALTYLYTLGRFHFFPIGPMRCRRGFLDLDPCCCSQGYTCRSPYPRTPPCCVKVRPRSPTARRRSSPLVTQKVEVKLEATQHDGYLQYTQT